MEQNLPECIFLKKLFLGFKSPAINFTPKRKTDKIQLNVYVSREVPATPQTQKSLLDYPCL